MIMTKYKGAANFAAGVVLTFLILSVVAFKQHKSLLNLWTAPSIPDKLNFAGEPVPLQNWEVKEKFDREYLLNYYSQGSILYLLKLSNRNFPIISARLKANGVPDDFKYLCIAESMMQSWAVSKSGAVGYWQFMPGTAPGYGLTVNAEVDQRKDLEKSTDAAAKYIKQAYQKFGSWTAAAASYNCGMGGYSSQAAFQRTNNYYDLLLPEETNKYIFRIIAFKHLLENARDLGFDLKEEEKYQPLETRSYEVNAPIPDLAAFAISQGTTYKVLRALNPWIKGKSLTAIAGKNYVLRLPLRNERAEP
jgi:membrane-bound lytic murein transglycosylase D